MCCGEHKDINNSLNIASTIDQACRKSRRKGCTTNLQTCAYGDRENTMRRPDYILNKRMITSCWSSSAAAAELRRWRRVVGAARSPRSQLSLAYHGESKSSYIVTNIRFGPAQSQSIAQGPCHPAALSWAEPIACADMPS